MKIKTSELTGAQLDWAVAKAENKACEIFNPHSAHNKFLGYYKNTDFAGNADIVSYSPSTDWSMGGPIIEREGLSTHQQRDMPGFRYTENRRWWSQSPGLIHTQYGPTPLIAAMRCYVASTRGDEVDIPEELL
jgi:hypothetical protein